MASKDRNSNHCNELCMLDIERKFEGRPAFVENVRKLYHGTNRMAGYAHEYDFSSSTPANGYRSFVRLFSKLFALLASSRVSADDDVQMVQLDNTCQLFVSSLDFLERMRKLSPGELFCKDKQFNRDLFEKATALSTELKWFYGQFNNFWIAGSLRNVLNHMYMNLITLFYKPWSAFRYLTNSNHVGETFADFNQNVKVDFVKRIWSLSEIWFYRSLLPFLMYGFSPKEIRTVHLPVANHWTIDATFYSLSYRKTVLNTRRKPIRCRVLRGRQDSDEEALVLHVHGAGFISQTPDSHDSYLRDWAIKLNTVPIVSVDYDLSPEVKHPVALQQVLDVYMFLTGGGQEVIDLIGFHPKRIVLVGDSAGASLIISLTLVLNDIRRKMMDDGESIPFQMPWALVAMYPCTNMNYSASPSKLFCAFETFLSTGAILEIYRAYVPIDGDNLGVVSKQDVDLPWYRQSYRFDTLSKLDARSCDPYISTVFYEHYQDLANVQLYLVSGEFDALLDDAVALAGLWPKDKVTMDMLEDLPHGFLYFLSCSAEAKKGSDLACSRILQATKKI